MERKFTREEIQEAIREAKMAVKESGVPESLKEKAFEKAFEAFLGLGTPVSTQTAAIKQAPDQDGPNLSAVAARLGLELGDVADLYHVDGDVIGVGLAPSRLDRRKTVGTKQIALLVAAGRQASGAEDWTPVRVLREAARDYGRFDPSNFATTIKEMGDVFNLRGRGQQVEVRVTRPGYERAASLIRELMTE